jgi:DNA-binding beta-propeller fold protein YncE
MRYFLCLVLSASAAFAAEGYHVIQKIKIGGSATWDRQALDESGRRLYISNDTRIVVVDLDAGKVVGEVAGAEGIRGIALAPELGRGFFANARSNDVTIFDLKTLKPIGKVETGGEPGPVVFEPKTARVFAFNLAPDDNTATVIDAKTGQAAGKVTLGGKAPAAAADGSGNVYIDLQITNEDWNVSSEIGVIDADKLTLLRHSSITPCDRPADLAMDVKNHRAFVACGNAKMGVVDAESGKVIGTVTIGKLAAGAGFDPGSGLAFAASGEGTMAVVSETGGKFDVAETVPTLKGARNLTVDPKTHNVYLPAVDEGSFSLLVVGK